MSFSSSVETHLNRHFNAKTSNRCKVLRFLTNKHQKKKKSIKTRQTLSKMGLSSCLRMIQPCKGSIENAHHDEYNPVLCAIDLFIMHG